MILFYNKNKGIGKKKIIFFIYSSGGIFPILKKNYFKK
jgi:hypothetical protein